MKKKCSDETQTLHAGCSKAKPKFFAPLQTPLPEARDGQNLISWRRRSLPLPTNPVWSGSMHTILSYRGNSILYNNEHVLNRILPTKIEPAYQLRPRRHNRSLIMKANVTNECDFIVRMLFKTSINVTVSHFYYQHLHLSLFYMFVWLQFVKLPSDLI